MPIWPMRPSAFIVASVSRCPSQPTRLCTCIRARRGTPHRRSVSAICAGPSEGEPVQTLSAANRVSGMPSWLRPWPMVAWDEPYMGEESIMPPPASKKACMTAVRSASASALSPTLKVIQVPSPTTGMATPLDGTVFVVRGPDPAPAAGCAPARDRPSVAARPVAAAPVRMVRRSNECGMESSGQGMSRCNPTRARRLRRRDGVPLTIVSDGRQRPDQTVRKHSRRIFEVRTSKRGEPARYCARRRGVGARSTAPRRSGRVPC